MATTTTPPPRPSRANTATLNDLFTLNNQAQAHTPTSTLDRSQRRLSAPTNGIVDNYYSDAIDLGGPPNEGVPPERTFTTRSRSGTTTSKPSNNAKKGSNILSFMSFMSNSKRPEISTPFDPVHLTHVGFNASTGEFTGLPREWQQLLHDSGISRSEQEKNPQAVMEIVKFYQEGQGGRREDEVWEKMGAVKMKSPSIDVSSVSFFTFTFSIVMS